MRRSPAAIKRLAALRQQVAVRRDGQIRHTQRLQMRNEFFNALSHQRLAARDPHFANPQTYENPRQAPEFPQDRISS